MELKVKEKIAKYFFISYAMGIIFIAIILKILDAIDSFRWNFDLFFGQLVLVIAIPILIGSIKIAIQEDNKNQEDNKKNKK